MPHPVKNENKTHWLLRIVNSLGSNYMKINPNAFSLDSDYLHEKAIKDTGLTDFGDPYYREGLEVLLRDLSKNVETSFMGRVKFQNVLLRQLGNRLRFVAYKKRHPEVFEKPLLNPLVITGLPRSGTTYLHRLINEDLRWRSLKLYEVLNPIPPEPGRKDTRLSDCQNELRFVSQIVPELDSKHLLRPEAPEECLWLFGITFCSYEYLYEMPLYEYQEWFLQQDRTKAYQEYAQLLQIFQAQTPDQPLLLKAPIHRVSLSYLKEAIPNVQLVITKRDMLTCLSSYCSLQYTVLRLNVRTLDKKKIGQEAITVFQKGEAQQQAFLEQHPALNCQVVYEQLLQDPLTVVRNIYQHYGRSMTPETEEKMRSYALTHPQNKYGVHRYDAEDYGIEGEMLTSISNTNSGS